MAFVAISKDFMSRVESKISNMCRAELKTLGDKPDLALNPSDPFFISTIWKEHAHLYPMMPREWLSKHPEVSLKFKVPDANFADESRNHFGFKAKTTGANQDFSFPPNHSYYNTVVCDPYNPIMSSILEYAVKHKEIEQRWEKVNIKVVEFLRACKSANEAIKLWPDVKTYFDSEDVKRLDVKVVRSGSKDSAAAAALANIDTNEMMSAAVIARLSGAQV
jgi:flagellar motility protein MotE (MotC chaperone)